MPAVVVEGIPPWDGRYEFDDFGLTNRELYRIKQLSGIRAAELVEALEANDTAAYVAFAVAIVERTGLNVDVEDLWNAKVGSISLDFAGDDADPPTTLADEGETSETESSSGGGSGSDGV